MINLTKLWTGAEQPADGLRYGHGHGAATERPQAAQADRGLEHHANVQPALCPLLLGLGGRPDTRRADWEQMVDGGRRSRRLRRSPPSSSRAANRMIHPRFFDLVESRFARRGLKLTISTNGTLITPEKAALLKEAKSPTSASRSMASGRCTTSFRRQGRAPSTRR